MKIMKLGLVTFMKVEEGRIYSLFKSKRKFLYFVVRNKSIFKYSVMGELFIISNISVTFESVIPWA